MATLAPWRSSVPETSPTEPEVIHHDRQLLILHKPPGLPTTAPTDDEPCLTQWVAQHFPGLRAHATSRLDSQVSGLVTFALTREANEQLLAARRAGAYGRRYLGITLREVAANEGEWRWPISIDPRNPRRRIAGPGRGEREALSRYALLARTPNASLLELMPATGRTHQLRVHAAEAGLPLFGDPLYQGERRAVLPNGSVVTARRVMLHCAQVSFPSLSSDARFVVEAPIRADMEKVWLALGGARSELQA